MTSLSACDNTLDPDSHLMRSPFGSPINSQDHLNTSHPHLYSSVLNPNGSPNSWSYQQHQQHPCHQYPQFHSRQNSNSMPVAARNIMSPLQNDSLHQSPGIKSSVIFDNIKKNQYRHGRQHSANDNPLYQQNHAQTLLAALNHSRSDSYDSARYGFLSQAQPQPSSRGHIAGMAMVSMPSSDDSSSHSKHTQDKLPNASGQKPTPSLKRRITKEKLAKNDREEVRDRTPEYQWVSSSPLFMLL